MSSCMKILSVQANHTSGNRRRKCNNTEEVHNLSLFSCVNMTSEMPHMVPLLSGIMCSYMFLWTLIKNHSLTKRNLFVLFISVTFSSWDTVKGSVLPCLVDKIYWVLIQAPLYVFECHLLAFYLLTIYRSANIFLKVYCCVRCQFPSTALENTILSCLSAVLGQCRPKDINCIYIPSLSWYPYFHWKKLWLLLFMYALLLCC